MGNDVTLYISHTTSCARHVFIQVHIEGFRCLDMPGVQATGRSGKAAAAMASSSRHVR